MCLLRKLMEPLKSITDFFGDFTAIVVAGFETLLIRNRLECIGWQHEVV